MQDAVHRRGGKCRVCRRIHQLWYGIDGAIREHDGDNRKPLSATDASRTILRTRIVRRATSVLCARITGHQDDDVACLQRENT